MTLDYPEGKHRVVESNNMYKKNSENVKIKNVMRKCKKMHFSR